MNVTIIIPLHNSKKYINECMDSVVNQTLQEIEIICIDSGSDETSDIIESYARNDKRIKYIYDDNSSYGYKINKGIALAQGKYIAIIESDDYARKDMIQVLYELAEKNCVDFIKSDFKKSIDLNGRRIESNVEQIPNKLLYNRVINLNEEQQFKDFIGYNIWVGLYRKEFLISNKIVLNESPGASYQDTGFSILISLLAKKIYFTDHLLYSYRIDNDESSVKSQTKYRCIIDEFRWIKEQMQSRGIDNLDNLTFYKNKKLLSYFWNYRRLSKEYQIKFLKEIREEIECDYYLSLNYLETLSHQQINEVKLLHGDVEAANMYERNKEKEQFNFRNVVSIINSKKQIVIFGAGHYGEVLMLLANIINKNENIVSICDNDKQKYNREIFGLRVGDPESTVSKYKSAFYLCANKKSSKDILLQLNSYGVLKDNICAVEVLPGKSTILEAVLNL